MLQTKQTKKGYLEGIERKKLAVQAKNFKNCNPLGIQKKKKNRIHFHNNKYYNQDK